MRGVTLADVFAMIRSLDHEQRAPLVLFSYYNPIRIWLRKFADEAQRCGSAGVLVTDLPAEASTPLRALLHEREIDLIVYSCRAKTGGMRDCDRSRKGQAASSTRSRPHAA
jgi:tryptophan synthase alpha chain